MTHFTSKIDENSRAVEAPITEGSSNLQQGNEVRCVIFSFKDLGCRVGPCRVVSPIHFFLLTLNNAPALKRGPIARVISFFQHLSRSTRFAHL